MDRLSHLPDELLLRILSFLPTTKDVVPTMVLSKRWKFLWMFVPKLVYDDSYQSPEYARFSRFVDRSLFMHDAPVVETLHFTLGQICGAGDIQVWIRAAHKCRVRELIIETNTSSSTNFPMRLPRSLYTCCRMLVALNLSNGELVDDVSSLASFPSLKKLSLISMKFPGDKFVDRFLSSCPVLEDLVVKRDCIDGVTTFSIIVPSLKSLVLHKSYDVDTFVAGAYGIVIDAPSLELLDVFDDTDSFPVLKSDMPKVVDAKVVISCDHPEQIMGSITSVKRLRLCVKDAYPVGTLFYCLVSLNICTCEIEWLNLLMHVLRDSPNLQALKFEKCREPECDEPRQCWIEPSTVPKCLLTNLETMEWVKYKGTEEEIEVVAFILGNGSCLKKVTIHPKSTSDHKKLKMSKELSFLPRRSPTCRLSFD